MGRHQSSGPPDRSRCVAGPDREAAVVVEQHARGHRLPKFPSGSSRSHSSTPGVLALVISRLDLYLRQPDLCPCPNEESAISLTSFIAQFGWFRTMLRPYGRP